MNDTELICRVAMRAKRSLCLVAPMARLELPLVHAIDHDDGHHVLALDLDMHRAQSAEQIAGALAAGIDGWGALRTVGVIFDAHSKHHDDLQRACGELDAYVPGDYARELAADVTSTVRTTLVICTVRTTGERHDVLLPYGWDDHGLPVWEVPKSPDAVMVGPLADLPGALMQAVVS